MEDLLEGIQDALSDDNWKMDRKQVHFNSKIVINQSSFREVHNSNSSVQSSLLNSEDSIEESPNENILMSKETEEAALKALMNENDRLFLADPPSSLFDISSLTKSVLSIQNQEEPSLSEMITPLDPISMDPKPKTSPKPATRQIKFDWPRRKSDYQTDPFLDSPKKDPTAEDDIDDDIMNEKLQSDSDETIRKGDDEIDQENTEDYAWIGSDNPLELYRQAHSGGSLIQDDFFELKKEMDQHYSNENEQFNNDILAQIDDDEISQRTDSSFRNNNEKEESTGIDQQTPHIARTLHSISDELFSPGSFFASRSGQLGDLEAKDQTSRPTWYTPKHDPHGRLIDPIEITPNERLEKNQLKSANMRKPLYVPTPATERKIDLFKTIDLNEDQSDPMPEKCTNRKYSESRPIKNTCDPFDWENALETTIPDTTITDALDEDLEKKNEPKEQITIQDCFLSEKIDDVFKILLSSVPNNLTFPVQSETRNIALALFNNTSKEVFFTFNQIGNCTLTNDETTPIVDQNTLLVDCKAGKISPNTHFFIHLTFRPMKKGTFRNLFRLGIGSHVTSVLFEGHSQMETKSSQNSIESNMKVKSNCERTSKSKSYSQMDSISPKNDQEKSTFILHTDYNMTPIVDKALKNSSAEFFTPRNPFSVELSSQSTGKKLCTPKLITHKLEFGMLKYGESKSLYLRICNPGKKSIKVSFTVTGCDFLIPIKDIFMTSRSYLILPICFMPQNVTSVERNAGTPTKKTPSTRLFNQIEERLIIKKDFSSTIRIGLLGEIN